MHVIGGHVLCNICMRLIGHHTVTINLYFLYFCELLIRHMGTINNDEIPLEAKAQGASVAKKEKKTKISFEECEAITKTIAYHLTWRRNTPKQKLEEARFRTKSIIIGRGRRFPIGIWEPIEQDIGDSMENLISIRKKVNLVNRILVTVRISPRIKRKRRRPYLRSIPTMKSTNGFSFSSAINPTTTTTTIASYFRTIQVIIITFYIAATFRS